MHMQFDQLASAHAAELIQQAEHARLVATARASRPTVRPRLARMSNLRWLWSIDPLVQRALHLRDEYGLRSGVA